MTSTRYLALRYGQLRAKLFESSIRDDVVFSAADDRELNRIYDELCRRDAFTAYVPQGMPEEEAA